MGKNKDKESPKKRSTKKADGETATVPPSPSETAVAGENATLKARIAELEKTLAQANNAYNSTVDDNNADVDAMLNAAGSESAKIGVLQKELQVATDLYRAEKLNYEQAKLGLERAETTICVYEKDIAEQRAKTRGASQQLVSARGADELEALKANCQSVFLEPATDKEAKRILETKATKSLLPNGKQYDGKTDFQQYVPLFTSAANERGIFKFDAVPIASLKGQAVPFLTCGAIVGSRHDLVKWQNAQTHKRVAAVSTSDTAKVADLNHEKDLNLYFKKALMASITVEAREKVRQNEADSKSTCGLTYWFEVVKTFLPDTNEIICQALAELATLTLEDCKGDVGEYAKRQLDHYKWLHNLLAVAGTVLPHLQAQVRKCQNQHFSAEVRILDAKVKAAGHNQYSGQTYLEEVRVLWEDLPASEKKTSYAAAAAASSGRDKIAMTAAVAKSSGNRGIQADDDSNDADDNLSKKEIEAYFSQMQSRFDKFKNEFGRDGNNRGRGKGRGRDGRNGRDNKRSFQNEDGNNRYQKKGRGGDRKPHGMNKGDKWYLPNGSIVLPNATPKSLGYSSTIMLASAKPGEAARSVYWCSKCQLWTHRTNKCHDLSDEQKKKSEEMDKQFIMVSALDVNAFNAEHEAAEAALLAEAMEQGSIDGSELTEAFESTSEDMDMDPIPLDSNDKPLDLDGLMSIKPVDPGNAPWQRSPK